MMPDKSVGNVTTISQGSARRTRKTVSIYDRVEEARERRASVLGSQPANISSAAPARKPRAVNPEPVQVPVQVQAPEPEQIAELPAPEAQTSPLPDTAPARSATRWTIAGLTALLLILTGIALTRIEAEPPVLAPEFNPPIVSLTPQAYGPPLLATVSHGNDQSVKIGDPAMLAGLSAGRSPAVDTAVPAPKAPALMEIVDGPRSPAANPAALVVLPNDLRPPERPDQTPGQQN